MAYIYDLTDTWNAGGTTFYGIKMNVTNSASAAGTRLLSLQVSGSEKFGVEPNGFIGVGTSDITAPVTVKTRNVDSIAVRILASSGGTGGLQFTDDPVTIGFGFISATSTLMNVTSSTVLALGSSGAEKMRIDSSGNVGIGTASPGQALDVVGNIRASSTLLAAAIQTGYGVSTGDCAVEIGGDRTGSGPSYVDFHSTSGTDFEARILRNSGANGDFGITNTGTGFLTINNIGFGAVVLGTNNTERVRITPTGNVGIGTSTPAASLDINGSQVTRGDADGFILFAPKEGTEPFGTNYDRFEIRVDDTAQVTTLGNTNGGTGSARALGLVTGGTERVRIKTDGQMRLVPLSGDPAGAENGDMYYNSTTHKFRGYANGSWVDLH